jgi:DnaJ-class molecular chaperone
MAGSTTKQALLLWGAATTGSIVSAASNNMGPLSAVSVSHVPRETQLSSSSLGALSFRGGSLEDAINTSDNKTKLKKESKSEQKNKKKKNRSRKTDKDQDQQSSSSDADPDAASSSSSHPGKAEPSIKPNSSSNKKPPPPSAIVQEILKQDDFYEILGLNRELKTSITERAIQKAYRRRTLLTHPDKTNGDRRAFDKVAEAYQVLSDSKQRAVYDKFGKAGLEHGSNVGMGGSAFASADDFFQSFFGNTGASSFFGAPQPQQRAQRNRTVRYQLEVSLEDLYRGVSQSIQINAGGNSPLRKTVSVDIPKGAQEGHSIRLSGEVDFDTTQAPGDLLFWLKQRPHPIFTRKYHDLAVTMSISLQEAVCGVKRGIPHLSGELLVIGSARNTQGEPVVIQNGDVHVLKGKGMPKDKLGTSFGDLYVQYEVGLPNAKLLLTNEERAELSRLLNKLEGKGGDPAPVDEDKVQYSQPAKASDFGRASGIPPPVSHDDDTLHHDDDISGSPFSRRGFFASASSPFGFPFEQDGDNVQCQQM